MVRNMFNFRSRLEVMETCIKVMCTNSAVLTLLVTKVTHQQAWGTIHLLDLATS